MTEFKNYNPETAGRGASDDKFVWPELPEGYFWTAGWRETYPEYGESTKWFSVGITKHSHHRNFWAPWKTKPCTCVLLRGNPLFQHHPSRLVGLLDFDRVVQAEIHLVKSKFDQAQVFKAKKAELDQEIAKLTERYAR